MGLDFRGVGGRGGAERERIYLQNLDDLLSLSVALHKEMQNPAKDRVKAPPSGLAANESQIKVSPRVFCVSEVSACFLPPFVAVAGRPN